LKNGNNTGIKCKIKDAKLICNDVKSAFDDVSVKPGDKITIWIRPTAISDGTFTEAWVGATLIFVPSQ